MKLISWDPVRIVGVLIIVFAVAFWVITRRQSLLIMSSGILLYMVGWLDHLMEDLTKRDPRWRSVRDGFK